MTFFISMIIYGKNSVRERLNKNSDTIKKVFLRKDFSQEAIVQLLKKQNIPFSRLSSHEMRKFKKGEKVPSIVALVKDFQYTDFEVVLKNIHNNFLLIFMDRIFDPHNLGAIIRLAACMGDIALIIPVRHACPVTEVVLHTAAGGENYVPIVRENNLRNCIQTVQEYGYRIIGADFDPTTRNILGKYRFSFPLGLVIGSEGRGIRYGLHKYIDEYVRIPMEGAALSYNAAMACALFCYEIKRQMRTNYE